MSKENKSLIYFGILTLLFLIIFSILYYFNKYDIYLVLLMFTPTISVILAKLISKEKLEKKYLKLNFKGNKKWYLSAYFLTPLIAFCGAFLYFLIFKNDLDLLGSKFAIESGITNNSQYISTVILMITLAIIVNPLMGIVQCFGEEFAWRSYLLPKLSKKFTIRKAIILNGFIWGIWHSPLIAMGYNYGTSNPILGIIAMIIFCIILGIIESFLFIKTKSVWTSVIFHASINGIDLYSPSSLFMSKTPNMFIGPDSLGIIGGIGFIIIAIIILIKLKDEKVKL